MERIDDSLRKITPMLTHQSNYDFETESQHNSVINKSVMGSNSRDNKSVMSMPMSVITKRTNLTMLTYKTHLNGGVESLPKDMNLREIAEKRLLKEID
jgi:hypothetical protein